MPKHHLSSSRGPVSVLGWILGAVALVSGLSGCKNPSVGSVESAWVRIQDDFRILGDAFKGRPTPSPSPSASPNLTVVESSRPTEDKVSETYARAKGNSEFLLEIFRVVLIQEPRNREEFGNWVDSLNQGASFEGVYNGFTHSAEYHKLEISGPAASPRALKTFGDEMAQFQLEASSIMEFEVLGSNGVPTPVLLRENVGMKKPKPEKLDLEAVAGKYTKQFVGTSIFTLKRVLGDEALRIMEEKKGFPEKLGTWYAKWVVRLADRGVDFGLPLRNKPDEDFHYKWALGAGEDRLKWEVLNRVHRLINDANQNKR